jgi:hypothetical protein
MRGAARGQGVGVVLQPAAGVEAALSTLPEPAHPVCASIRIDIPPICVHLTLARKSVQFFIAIAKSHWYSSPFGAAVAVENCFLYAMRARDDQVYCKTVFMRSWSTPSRAFFLLIWTFTVQPAALLQRAAFRSCHGRGRALSSAHNRAVFLASSPEPSGLGIFAPRNKRCLLPKRFTRLILSIVFSCVLF